ncbi:anti-sigma factor [Pelagibius litoralis]|uniref:Anti-sigma factor n=1 Tax=Pelagibius litoralis TaxID=374515 RepID=A0A967EXF4_9PROT|nr:anti-sigma factor [Pelagibius litoralis]NIA69185.1 anti-sigma factor [Pelagibius litoralis]
MSEDELQAYVDGQLPTSRRVGIEGYLAAHPAESERLANYRNQNIGLHALFDSRGGDDDLADVPPEIARLAAQLDRQNSRSRLSSGQLPRLAAGFALLLTAGGAGWIAHDQLNRQGDPLVAFTRQAAEAHAVVADRRATSLAEASGQQVSAWLSEHSKGTPLSLPDLESVGFRLIADSVIPAAIGKRAAQLIYQDEEGQRITLYMRAGQDAEQTTFTFRREGQVSQFFWQNGRFAYSLIGMMEQERLLEIAEVVSDELQTDGQRTEDGGILSDDRANELPSTLMQPETIDKIDALGDAADEAGKAGAPAIIAPPSEAVPERPKLLPLELLPVPLSEPENIPKDT